jgi:hypothetical protein
VLRAGEGAAARQASAASNMRLGASQADRNTDGHVSTTPHSCEERETAQSPWVRAVWI